MVSIASRVAAGIALAFICLTVVGISSAAGGSFAFWNYLTSDLPEFEDAQGLRFETTKIYDRNWRLLHEVSDPNTGWRTEIGYQEILDHIERNKAEDEGPERAWIFDATVAAEDGTFWTNPGVDPLAIVRSFVLNVSGGPSSGASTITQQLVRSMYPESIGYEQSYTRKAREAVMAYEYNQRYTKEQILEMYLNTVYYGNRAYGIDAAAQAYFNTFAWDLTLAEASLLAGLPQAPSYYNPSENFDTAKARQQYVLDRMVELEMITQAEANEAFEQPLDPQRRENRYDLAPHWVNFVRYELEQRYGAENLYRGGLMVRTTLDLELQEQAQQIVTENVAELEPWDANNGTLVAMLPWSGEIVSMVGSADYYNDEIDGQVNVAMRERQPGSSIKPVTYLAALEKGWHPGTMIFDYGKEWDTPDAPQETYAPQNAARQYYGAVSMRDALGGSLNIPAVQALDHVGVEDMIDLSQRMGIRNGLWRGTSHYGLAITLGGGEVTPLEHTNVFATLANNGRYVPYTPFLEIIDSSGEKIYELDRENALENGNQTVRPEHAYQVTDMLSDNDARSMIFGTDSPLAIPELDDRTIAAKTGTTTDSRDGWTMGYSTEISVGVWVGNTDNTETRDLSGVAGAAPIWNEFMQLIHADERFVDLLSLPSGDRLPKEMPRPDRIVEREVCVATGKQSIDGAETRTEVLTDGGPPRLDCDRLNEYEEEELEAALEFAEENSDEFASGALDRLYRYAEMVGVISESEEESDAPQRPFPGGGQSNDDRPDDANGNDDDEASGDGSPGDNADDEEDDSDPGTDSENSGNGDSPDDPGAPSPDDTPENNSSGQNNDSIGGDGNDTDGDGGAPNDEAAP